MAQHPATPILWRGRETVDEVLDRLQEPGGIELQLANEYHHALFRALHPDAPPGQPEELDAAGGAELLQRLEHIRGLEAIAELVAPLQRGRAHVHVTGRAKIAITVPPAGA